MKIDKIVLAPIPNDPVNNGEIIYNSSLGKFRKREAGVTSDLNTGGGGSYTLERGKIWAMQNGYTFQ